MRNFKNDECKICKSTNLVILDQSAQCLNCKVLLYYPYPKQKKPPKVNFKEWYRISFDKNIKNFLGMILYTTNKSKVNKSLNILDYGGGSGQFALIYNSLFPRSKVHIVDIVNESLFNEFKPLNKQIKYEKFPKDKTKFDIIFLNDVYEHVEDPVNLLTVLRTKLKPAGIIFIDTPRQFWIYPFFKYLFKPIYRKIVKGTVSKSHLQIWSDESFKKSVQLSNLKIQKISYFSELTMDTDLYLQQMGIKFKPIKLIIRLFSRPLVSTFYNKIYCVLEK